MILEKEEQDDFFQNYFPLLYYAGVYEGIVAETSTMKDFFYTDMIIKVTCRNILFSDADAIKFYKKDNIKFLGKDPKLAFVNNVQNGILGKFVFLHEDKDKSIFHHIESKKFYAITAITESLSKMVPNYPASITTAIFNFKGKIICDGLIGHHAILGTAITENLMAGYKECLKNNAVVKKI